MEEKNVSFIKSNGNGSRDYFRSISNKRIEWFILRINIS